jgi:putative hydrolase of HD superfamily
MPDKPFHSGLIRRLFRCASLQRWNDQVRPVEFTELDKQAHKMIIAYVLAKFEEKAGNEVDWQRLIEGAIFESLQRSLLTDLKPAVFDRMMQEKGPELNAWVLEQLEPEFAGAPELFERMRNWFLVQDKASLEKRLLRAAHNTATRWEFQIIYAVSPFAHNIQEVKREIDSRMEDHAALAGFPYLFPGGRIASFLDLCGQLRFQKRWSQSARLPETSVLGHMFFVAVMVHLSLLKLQPCQRRIYNDFFTALFHDLPEVLTRDITSPVKTSVPGLDGLIKDYERKLVQEKLLPLLPAEWHGELRFFIEEEFTNRILLNGLLESTVTASELCSRYNADLYDPRDGELIKVCDHLAAFIEASTSVRQGVTSEALEEGLDFLRGKYAGCRLAGLDFAAIFSEFDQTMANAIAGR